MTQSERKRTRPVHWGTLERFFVVFALLTVLALQALIVAEVFSNADPDFVAAASAAYNILAALLIYLMFTIMGDFVEKQVEWALPHDLSDRYGTALRTAVWAFAAAGMVWTVFNGNALTDGYRDLARATDVISGILAFRLALRAVPTAVWESLYSALLFSGIDDRAQSTATNWWLYILLITGIVSLIVAVKALQQTGVLPL